MQWPWGASALIRADGQCSGHSSAGTQLFPPESRRGATALLLPGARDVKREQCLVPEQAPTATALHQPLHGGWGSAGSPMTLGISAPSPASVERRVLESGSGSCA